MKTILYAALSLSIGITYVDAQTVSGTKMLGGGVTYSSEKIFNYEGEDYKESELTFQPSMGYFVGDRIVVGINLLIGSTKNEVVLGDNKTNRFGIGPFARYYIHSSNENFAFFAQAAVLYQSVKHDFVGDGSDYKGKELDIAVSPGFAFFFNEHWSVELSLRGIGLTSSDPNKDLDDDETTRFEIRLNSLDPSIGVRYYFE